MMETYNEYVQLMEVGAIGEFVVKPVEMEISQELVQTQHRNLEELIVQAIQLRIVRQKNALVNTLPIISFLLI